MTNNDVAETAVVVENNASSSGPSSSGAIRRHQALLSTKMFVPSPTDKEKLTDAVAKFVVSTCSPYSIVESDGFRNLMKVAAPNYDVPSRRTFSDRKIPQLFIKMRDHIVSVVSHAPYVSLTMDAWTAGNKRHFLGVTCSTIMDNWRMGSFTIACREADMSHTAANLQILLEEVLDDFGIDKANVVSITTDRAANMLAAVAKIGINSVPCIAHTINTAVNKVMEHGDIVPIMQKIRSTYNIFAHSANANRALATIQVDKGCDVFRMPSSCKTRWWSELRQIVFVTTQEEALVKFLKEYSGGIYDSLLLEHRETRMLTELLPMLQKLEKFSGNLSVESEATSSAILKSVHDIKVLLVNFKGGPITGGLVALRTHMRAVANDFSHIYDEVARNTSHLNMAAYFDPRFEKCDAAAMEAIVRLDAQVIDSRMLCVSKAQSVQSKSNLADLFEDADTMMDIADTNASPVEDEISRYNCETRVAYAENVLDWWKCRETMYPILSRIARKYLCISASSVATERVFSTGGAILTKTRFSMTDEHSEQLILLAKNKIFP